MNLKDKQTIKKLDKSRDSNFGAFIIQQGNTVIYYPGSLQVLLNFEISFFGNIDIIINLKNLMFFLNKKQFILLSHLDFINPKIVINIFYFNIYNKLKHY